VTVFPESLSNGSIRTRIFDLFPYIWPSTPPNGKLNQKKIRFAKIHGFLWGIAKQRTFLRLVEGFRGK